MKKINRVDATYKHPVGHFHSLRQSRRPNQQLTSLVAFMVIPKTLVLVFFQCLWSSSDGTPGYNGRYGEFGYPLEDDFDDFIPYHHAGSSSASNASPYGGSYVDNNQFPQGVYDAYSDPFSSPSNQRNPYSHHQLFGIGVDDSTTSYLHEDNQNAHYAPAYENHASAFDGAQGQGTISYQSDNWNPVPSYGQVFDIRPHNPQGLALSTPQEQSAMAYSSFGQGVESSGKKRVIRKNVDPQTDAYLKSYPNVLAMYFISHLQYPIHRESHENYVEFISEVIEQSKFDYKPNYAKLTRIFSKDPIDLKKSVHPDTKQREKRLLANLCLKNLGFLFALEQLQEDRLRTLIMSQMKDTLSWLHDKLSLGSNHDQELEKKVTAHYKQIYPHEATVIIQYPRSKQKLERSVTTLQAQESKIILELLECYYKEKDLEKWNILFPSNQPDSFLKFYVRFTQGNINGDLKLFKDHQNHHVKDFLPWDWHHAMPAESKAQLAKNKTRTLFFFGKKELYKHMHGHLRIEGSLNPQLY